MESTVNIINLHPRQHLLHVWRFTPLQHWADLLTPSALDVPAGTLSFRLQERIEVYQLSKSALTEL